MFASKASIRAMGFMVGLLALSPLVMASDVKVYEQAPSVEELQRQLTGGDSTPGKARPRTRAIVFGDASPAAQDAAPEPQVAAEPAAKPQQAQARPRPPQSQSQGQAQQAIQVSTNAIAFPINFRVNSSEILSESIPFLDSIAGLMQKDPGIRLMVEGHTDSSGSPTRNNSLSRELAYSVVNYLIERYRIDPMRLMPIGKGFSEPLEGMDSTNPKNRRVQFRVIG